MTFTIDEDLEELVPSLSANPNYVTRRYVLETLKPSIPIKLTAAKLTRWAREKGYVVQKARLSDGTADTVIKRPADTGPLPRNVKPNHDNIPDFDRDIAELAYERVPMAPFEIPYGFKEHYTYSHSAFWHELHRQYGWLSTRQQTGQALRRMGYYIDHVYSVEGGYQFRGIMRSPRIRVYEPHQDAWVKASTDAS